MTNPDLDATIKTFYADYLAAFHSLRPKRVAPYYAQPCVFMTESMITLLATNSDVEALFESIINDLVSKSYGYSEVNDLTVQPLGATHAHITGTAIRYTQAGTELERTGAAYTLRKLDDEWKFVSAFAYSI